VDAADGEVSGRGETGLKEEKEVAVEKRERERVGCVRVWGGHARWGS
jgi:hypothetical protein